MSGPHVKAFLLKDMSAPPEKKRKGLKTRPKTRHPQLVANSAVVLERAQGCQACDLIGAFVDGWVCQMYPVDVHHRRRQGDGGRKGGGHMLANLRVVCRSSHAWIHNVKNEELARHLGLLVMPDDPEWDALALEVAA